MGKQFAPYQKHDTYSGDFVADEELKKEEEMEKGLVPGQKKEVVMQNPIEEVKRGQECAQALQSVVAQKKKKVMIKGEQYLEFEDWQTLGRFFRYTCKTGDAIPCEINGVKGAKAKSYILCNGEEIGGAVAYCLKDEDNWKDKPWFQLASMAQTRAGAKAFRNVLAWVAVLAGYKGTPAEEMEGLKDKDAKDNRFTPNKPDTSAATPKQLEAIVKMARKGNLNLRDRLVRDFKKETPNELTRQEASTLITKLSAEVFGS